MRIYEDLRSLQRRLTAIQTGVLGIVLLLAAFFWHLQVLRGRYFRELAENNRIRVVTIPAPRGAILDRNGRILVENRSSFNIVLSPEHSENLRASIGRLARLLGIGVEQIQARLSAQGPRLRSVVVKADATAEDVASVEARRLEQPEAGVDVVPLRSYPLGAGAAHSLGRVGEITERQLQSATFSGIEQGALVGQAGIEYQYNRLLMGQDGMRRVIVNSRGVEAGEAEVIAPVDGPSINLTVDLQLQALMEEALKEQAGAAVALDPETGEILAMVSNPSYDPNLFSSGIEPTTWSGLVKDVETPLVNRAIQGQYPAGSTFKVVTALAALQEKVITPSTRFYCPGHLSVYNTVFRCHKAGGHGTVDLHWALTTSCNVYFYNVGIRLEIDRIARYATLLGLGRPTGVDLPNEMAGLIPSPDWKRRTQKTAWFGGETVSVSIGQGQVLVTAIQMARLAAVIANGGRLVRPHLLKSVRGMPQATPPAERTDLGFRPDVIGTVRDAMVSVVQEGTGWRARVPGVEVAGKTGSSQVVGHARLERDKTAREYQPHGWFICFAPAQNPKVAMAILVEHGRSGGESAAPVAAQILSRYFGTSLQPGGRDAVPPTLRADAAVSPDLAPD
jgi:penicillin-binding protein 2